MLCHINLRVDTDVSRCDDGRQARQQYRDYIIYEEYKYKNSLLKQDIPRTVFGRKPAKGTDFVGSVTVEWSRPRMFRLLTWVHPDSYLKETFIKYSSFGLLLPCYSLAYNTVRDARIRRISGKY